MAETHSREDVATRVEVSVSAAGGGDGDDEPGASAWIEEQVAKPSYERYLKRVHDGRVSVGDEWAEFVSRGCGSPRDVHVVVERVEGGDVLGPDTTIDVRRRDGGDDA